MSLEVYEELHFSMAHRKAHVRWDMETKPPPNEGWCVGFWRTRRRYKGNNSFLLKHGQRKRRRAHFSHTSLVVWAITQQTRKWESVPGLFQRFIYFGISWHWINILGSEGPSLSFLAQFILASFLQHTHFLPLTQQIPNYFSPRLMWDLSYFPENNCHIANPAKSPMLQKKGIVRGLPPQCTCGLTLAATTNFCCQGHTPFVRRIKYDFRGLFQP